jgi:hypothetical protein
MRSTELGCFRLRSWSLWKALEDGLFVKLWRRRRRRRRGALAWFHGVWTCSLEVLEY